MNFQLKNFVFNFLLLTTKGHLMSPLNSLDDYTDLAPAVVYKRVSQKFKNRL